MKGVVLLAVIHILIIYQSQKKKARHLNEIPEPPQVVVEAEPVKAKKNSQLNADYAAYMFTRTSPALARDFRY